MKKAIVLVLALMLTLSLAVPAAAVVSPAAPETSDTTTAPLPEIVETEVVTEDGTKTDDNILIIVEPIAVEDAKGLSEEAQKTYAAAQESLEEAVPAGVKTQYFFYVTIVKTDNERSFKENYDGSVNMTMKLANATKVVVKQFVDGKWVPLDAVINNDGTITIMGVVEGPIAIFTE